VNIVKLIAISPAAVEVGAVVQQLAVLLHCDLQAAGKPEHSARDRQAEKIAGKPVSSRIVSGGAASLGTTPPSNRRNDRE